MYSVLRGKWARLIGIGIVPLALFFGGSPTGALAAAETHAFDPELSLTGDCSSSPFSAADTIPDPGLCPIPPGIVWPNPGAEHPSSAFSNPAGVATDSYGNIYVASAGPELALGKEGKIDVFDAKGHFITEVADANGPSSLAIDSEGNLYVGNRFNGREVVRYEPTLPYEPEAGGIKYGSNPVTVVEKTGVGVVAGLDIGRGSDPQVADHLFVNVGSAIEEYESAAEGNDFVEEFSNSPNGGATGMAVEAGRGRIYASGEGAEGMEVRVYELPPPHKIIFTIKGASVPNGKFVSALLSLAVDEGSGHLFVYDGAAVPPRVYEFETSNSGATYLKSIDHEGRFEKVFGGEIGVDNGANSPNGALNPFERYLFVPSHPGGTGHSFAFGPPGVGLPVIESTSVANVGEEEAELEASIKPFGLETHYTFQYLTQQQFEEDGKTFNGVPVAGEGDIPAGSLPVDVATAVEGLESGATYRFRVFAENEEGTDEAEDEFATFPESEPSPPCPNDTLRTGFSALLPDCRAYELVTPPDTNARAPLGVFHAEFATREASPSGGAVSFKIEGGLIPGSEGTGSLNGDPYLSTRGKGGWSTAIAGPNGAEVFGVVPGSTSPDQGYSFWNTGGNGSAAIGGKETFYVRYPDGHSVLIGRGSLAEDPRGAGRLISENGGHIIFISGENGPAVQLEPNAPPDGTKAVYDRTADEVTHVVSLLPGDETPAAGAAYVGASFDGKGVAFSIGNTLYLRFDNEETYELGEGVTFAGIAEGGARAFYLEGGQLWRFDALSEERAEFSSVPVTPVNVAADGNTAYFVSQSVLTGEPNPNGAVAQGGQENLYRSEEGAISFVGTVTERDVEGQSNGLEQVEGLGLWTYALGTNHRPSDPSRTTPDGGALLFESRAALDGYDPEGNAEVYRYDFTDNELDCLSCNPTLALAASDASLQSISANQGAPEPLGSSAYVTNLRPDGRRAFFQSDEALVSGDVDGLQDVYEWEANGTGSCKREGGCVYLISSGHSLRPDYLYAASDSGDDVFFKSSDILLPLDAEETPSIYDARVGGGFPEPKPPICESEGCRPGVSPAPVSPNLASRASGPPGNVSPDCPRGKRKVKRHGKTVCVKKKHHKKHHHKKASKSRGAGK